MPLNSFKGKLCALDKLGASGGRGREEMNMIILAKEG